MNVLKNEANAITSEYRANLYLKEQFDKAAHPSEGSIYERGNYQITCEHWVTCLKNDAQSLSRIARTMDQE